MCSRPAREVHITCTRCACTPSAQGSRTRQAQKCGYESNAENARTHYAQRLRVHIKRAKRKRAHRAHEVRVHIIRTNASAQQKQTRKAARAHDAHKVYTVHQGCESISSARSVHVHNSRAKCARAIQTYNVRMHIKRIRCVYIRCTE